MELRLDAQARQRARHVLFLLLTGAAILVLAVFLGSRYQIGIPCVFYHATGFYCAGCGATRSVIALAHLDLYGAIQQNILFVLALPYIVYAVIRSLYAYVRYGKAYPAKYPKTAVVLFVVVVAAYTVARNTSTFEFLAPVTFLAAAVRPR